MIQDKTNLDERLRDLIWEVNRMFWFFEKLKRKKEKDFERVTNKK